MHARARPINKPPNIIAEEQFPAAEEWCHPCVCYRKPVANSEPFRLEQFLNFCDRLDELVW